MVSTNLHTHEVTCNECLGRFAIICDRKDLEAWLSGEKYIQDALNYLSAGERELLLSNTCDSCFKKMFDIDE